MNEQATTMRTLYDEVWLTHSPFFPKFRPQPVYPGIVAVVSAYYMHVLLPR